MGKDLQKFEEGQELSVVDRYSDLVPGATNGVKALEVSMADFERKNNKSFVQACVDKSMELANGEIPPGGSVGGMLKILDKIVPDLKSTEFKVKGMSDDERGDLAKSLSRSIVE